MAVNKDFFNISTINLAKKLLGKKLSHITNDGITEGIIVETEAYFGENDPASHSFRGQTKRNAVMFDEAGLVYIYFTYGMYYCFNVTSGPKDVGDAILIRALQPLSGIELMKTRRRKENIKDLCNGPAKLVIAMGITKNNYGDDLTFSNLFLDDYQTINDNQIVKTTRVGINVAKELPYRFYIKDNTFISKK